MKKKKLSKSKPRKIEWRTTFRVSAVGSLVLYSFNYLMRMIDNKFFSFAGIDDAYPYNLIFNASFFILNFAIVIAVGFFISGKAKHNKITNGAVGGGLSLALFVILNLISIVAFLIYYGKLPLNWIKIMAGFASYSVIYFAIGFLFGAMGAYTEEKKKQFA